MSTRTHHRRWSLSVITSLLAAGAVAGGMAIYAVAEFAANPSTSPLALALRHTWHVAVLGVLTYACIVIVLHRLLVHPIHKIYLHLYGIGSGKVKPLRLDSPVRELSEIVEGINVMIGRMHLRHDSPSREAIQTVAGELRHVAHTPAAKDLDLELRLTQAARTLDHAVARLTAEI